MDKRIRGIAYTIASLTIQGSAKEFRAKNCTMPTNSVPYRAVAALSFQFSTNCCARILISFNDNGNL